MTSSQVESPDQKGYDEWAGFAYGIVLNDNWKMIGLAKKLGFTMKRLSEGESKVTLEL